MHVRVHVSLDGGNSEIHVPFKRKTKLDVLYMYVQMYSSSFSSYSSSEENGGKIVHVSFICHVH